MGFQQSGSSEFDGVMREILDTDITAAEPEGDTTAGEAIPATTRKPDPVVIPARPAPKLATNPGDLVFVFGLRDDALTVALALARATPTIEIAVAGTIGKPGSRHVGDRREALQARADGVRRGGSTVVAIGAGLAPGEAEQYAAVLHDVVPDQVWIAVDVTRKPEDTRTWAHLVADAGGGVDAIAAIGIAYTTTPDSTSYLGIPVGWADGRTAP
ncbi:MAG: hypothetical protein QOF36_1973 [Microbacteriaceae bacterium]|nr:hypothetical protein [Microbacteriaceae bacterium]